VIEFPTRLFENLTINKKMRLIVESSSDLGFGPGSSLTLFEVAQFGSRGRDGSIGALGVSPRIRGPFSHQPLRG